MIYGSGIGIEWVDFNGKTKVVSEDKEDIPRGCTPDGKWVLYEDRDSARVYKDKQGRAPEITIEDGPGWYGFIMDVYRYEIETGLRQRFAVVRGDSSPLVSPDGSKVFLGNIHDSTIEMPEPKWETVWLTNEWLYGPTRWFKDSSGIVTMIWWGNGYNLGVEFFGEDGWAKEFSLKMLESGPGVSVHFEAVDENNVLYFYTVESVATDGPSRRAYNFFSCKIKRKDLICDFTSGLEEEEGDNIESLEVIPNGDIVYKGEEDNCIRRIESQGIAAECIADTRYFDDVYLNIAFKGVSPDGRWIAFRRGKMPPKHGERFHVYQYDLFVIDLKDD